MILRLSSSFFLKLEIIWSLSTSTSWSFSFRKTDFPDQFRCVWFAGQEISPLLLTADPIQLFPHPYRTQIHPLSPRQKRIKNKTTIHFISLFKNNELRQKKMFSFLIEIRISDVETLFIYCSNFAFIWFKNTICKIEPKIMNNRLFGKISDP